MIAAHRFGLGVAAALVVLCVVACSDDSDAAASFCQTSLPSGSYSQSCSDCSMSGTTLRCTCQGGPNGPQAASLDTCGCDTNANDLNNNQGVLKCTPKGSGGGGGSSGPKCKTSGNSCSSSLECCGLCNMNSKSSSYHTCN